VEATTKKIVARDEEEEGRRKKEEGRREKEVLKSFPLYQNSEVVVRVEGNIFIF